MPVARTDQPLNVAFEISPAPLKPFAFEVHLDSIALRADGSVVADKRNERLTRAIAEDPEDGEHWSDGHPQPGFHALLFGRRFVKNELRLLLKFAAKLFIRDRDRVTDNVLDLVGPGGALGNA